MVGTEEDAAREASLTSLRGSPTPGQAETLLAHGATPTRVSQKGCRGLKLPLAPKCT